MYKTTNLYQNDPKWKSSSLGNSSETIGGWGCLLTSVTMMLNGLGYNETPLTVNEKMKGSGGFQGAFFIPSMLPYAYPNCVYKGMQPCENSPAPLADIDAAVASGRPVILQVDWNKEAGIQTHFVLLKERVGEDYSLYDPYMYGGDGPTKPVLLTQRYKFNGAKLAAEISGVLWFDGTVPPAPPEKKKVPVPAEKFLVYVIEDDLALRDQPSRTGYLWKRLKAGDELICLEPKATAQAKIGKQEYVQVQDATGEQGYVAAWYVSTDKNAKSVEPVATATASATVVSGSTSAAKPATPAGPPPPGALQLVPTEEVSFRTQPVISAETLIRRVPPTEKFITLDPTDQAIAKVGVQNQWLKVRDQNNKDGYVAAWYVKYASGATAQAQAAATPPAPAGTPLKVRATAEGIALRRQPVVSDATLIYRLAMGSVFTVTEANADAKIGANNEWLKVKDPVGVEGYIAAWFVARA